MLLIRVIFCQQTINLRKDGLALGADLMGVHIDLPAEVKNAVIIDDFAIVGAIADSLQIHEKSLLLKIRAIPSPMGNGFIDDINTVGVCLQKCADTLADFCGQHIVLLCH